MHEATATGSVSTSPLHAQTLCFSSSTFSALCCRTASESSCAARVSPGTRSCRRKSRLIVARGTNLAPSRLERSELLFPRGCNKTSVCDWASEAVQAAFVGEALLSTSISWWPARRRRMARQPQRHRIVKNNNTEHHPRLPMASAQRRVRRHRGMRNAERRKPRCMTAAHTATGSEAALRMRGRSRHRPARRTGAGDRCAPIRKRFGRNAKVFLRLATHRCPPRAPSGPNLPCSRWIFVLLNLRRHVCA